MDELTGKVAVVTGGASGIGLALGRAFAAEGMSIVLADIEADALDKAVADLPEGTQVDAVKCDVSDNAQVDALRDRALDRFGAVHVVCNNAGVSAGGPVWENSLDDWRWVLGVNLWGVVHGIRAFTPLMIEQGEGHVVNTASMAGLISAPFMGMYNVSKHSVVTLSETLFADLQFAGAEGVGVSVLCPGWVQTRIHEAGRNRPAGSIEGGQTPVGDTAEGGEGAEEASGYADFVGALIAGGLAPVDVASQVVDAVRTRRFYVLTHPEWIPMVTNRTDRIAAGGDPGTATLPM